MEAYLGPDRPRWRPKDEAAIQEVVDHGWLAESHHIDIKREVGDKSGDRKETARDLASFAIDGGALLIGVEEDKAARTFSLAPQPLDGLVEKLEQVASFVVDPPLTIIPEEIPTAEDPTRGYLLVHVPPSASAPHMVGGQYFGRGERTRWQLSDAEVIRLHARRRSVEDEGARLLDIEIQRDPVPVEERQAGHLYLVAQPIGASNRLAHSIARGSQNAVYDLIWRTSIELLSDGVGEIPPTPTGYAQTRSSRSNGVALCSHALSGPGRTLLTYNDGVAADADVLDIEVRQDGGIRILVGRMTASISRTGAEQPVVLDGLAVAYARRLIGWAVALGEQSGWRGSWVLGLHANSLRGLGSYIFRQGLTMGYSPTFDEDEYREVTTATHLEMLQRPGAVAYRLAGRLVEALGTWQRFHRDLTDDTETV